VTNDVDVSRSFFSSLTFPFVAKQLGLKMPNIQVFARIRPPLASLNECNAPTAVRKFSDTVVALDAQALASLQGSDSKSITPQRTATPPPVISTPTTPRRPVGAGRPVTPREPPAAPVVKHHLFTLDGVFDGDESQLDVFEPTTADFVEHLFEGRNGAVMCYGPTGSGKTHTLIGPAIPAPSSSAANAATKGTASQPFSAVPDMGILPRTVMAILERLEWSQKRLAMSSRKAAQLIDDGQVYFPDELWLTAAEVYQDDVRDLLHMVKKGAPATAVKVPDQGGLNELLRPFIQKRITSVDDYRQCAEVFQAHRTVCSHDRNNQSSRSHALFYLQLKFRNLKEPTPSPPAVVPAPATGRATTVATPPPAATAPVACLALVDLAGSERVKRSQVEGQALLEAQAINKSLSTLCTVVTALYNKQAHIPYRDSRLTRMLRPCFEEGNLTTIVHLPPGEGTCDEASITLKFAERLRQVILAESGTQNTKAAYTTDQLQLEQQMTNSRRLFQELCAELRLCNESTGYIIRRIAKSAELDKKERFAAAFRFQREKDQDEETFTELKNDLVSKRMGPIRQRVLNMRRQLERVSELADEGKKALESMETKQSENESKRLESNILESTASAVVAKEAAVKVKASLQDHQRSISAAKAKLLDQLAERLKLNELNSERDKAEAESLQKEVQQLKYTLPLEERALQRLEEQLQRCAIARQSYFRVRIPLLAQHCALSWEALRLEAICDWLGEAEKDEPITAAKEGQEWQMPLVLSSGARVTATPTLLGQYDDEHFESLLDSAMAQLERGLLVNCLPVLLPSTDVVLQGEHPLPLAGGKPTEGNSTTTPNKGRKSTTMEDGNSPLPRSMIGPQPIRSPSGRRSTSVRQASERRSVTSSVVPSRTVIKRLRLVMKDQCPYLLLEGSSATPSISLPLGVLQTVAPNEKAVPKISTVADGKENAPHLQPTHQREPSRRHVFGAPLSQTGQSQVKGTASQPRGANSEEIQLYETVVKVKNELKVELSRSRVARKELPNDNLLGDGLGIEQEETFEVELTFFNAEEMECLVLGLCRALHSNTLGLPSSWKPGCSKSHSACVGVPQRPVQVGGRHQATGEVVGGRPIKIHPTRIPTVDKSGTAKSHSHHHQHQDPLRVGSTVPDSFRIIANPEDITLSKASVQRLANSIQRMALPRLSTLDVATSSGATTREKRRDTNLGPHQDSPMAIPLLPVTELVRFNEVRSLHAAMHINIFSLMASWDDLILAVCARPVIVRRQTKQCLLPAKGANCTGSEPPNVGGGNLAEVDPLPSPIEILVPDSERNSREGSLQTEEKESRRGSASVPPEEGLSGAPLHQGVSHGGLFCCPASINVPGASLEFRFESIPRRLGLLL
jgi:hypothetical protein